jgi:hypothetical protein
MKYYVLALTAFTMPMFAATYYIDWTAGSDTNNGTSKTTAWKHSPGMTGCANSCSAKTPAAGDRFIFKGGVIWPSAAMALVANNSGSNGNPIYYGVDTTWFTGSNAGIANVNGTLVTWVSGNAFQHNGSWDGGSITINGVNYTIAAVRSPYALSLTSSAGSQTKASYSNSLFVRPVFDSENLKGGGFATGSGVSYITLDSIEIKNTIIRTNGGGDATIFIGGATNGNIVLQNLDVHSWQRCLGSGNPTTACSAAMNDNSGSNGGIYAQMFGGLSPTNMTIQYSNVGNPENGGNIGSCTRGFQQLVGNFIHDCSQACLHGCQLVHDNVIYMVGKTFDGDTHTNVFYSDCFDGQCARAIATATAYLYNNWIIDSQGNSSATGGAAYPNPGTAGTSSSVTYYVFNNVVSCSSANSCNTVIGNEIDPYNGSGQVMKVYDWNNTYNLATAGTCVNVVSRSGISMNTVDVRNLHCVVPSGGTTFSAQGTASPASSNLLMQSVATANAQGYSAPSWNPISGSTATAGTGMNLSANCTGTLAALCSETTLGGTRTPNARPAGTAAWDIGAFQASAIISVTMPPPNLTASSL